MKKGKKIKEQKKSTIVKIVNSKIVKMLLLTFSYNYKHVFPSKNSVLSCSHRAEWKVPTFPVFDSTTTMDPVISLIRLFYFAQCIILKYLVMGWRRTFSGIAQNFKWGNCSFTALYWHTVISHHHQLTAIAPSPFTEDFEELPRYHSSWWFRK